MKVEVMCDWCSKKIYRMPGQLKGKKHIFCSRQCLADFSSKEKNPDGYRNLKDYTNMSSHMTALNQELNPNRMTDEVKEKLRVARLGTGEGKTYAKKYGRHEHRVVAEMILGRPLKDGEVVHHIDFNKRNNDPSNIMIFPSQADHAAYHAELNKFFETGEITPCKWKEVMPNEVHTT